ncbi:hypothetical protein [Pontibacter brevis]
MSELEFYVEGFYSVARDYIKYGKHELANEYIIRWKVAEEVHGKRLIIQNRNKKISEILSDKLDTEFGSLDTGFIDSLDMDSLFNN